MNFLRYFAYALVLIGALNWGLIGFFNFNLVSAILGDMTLLARIVYSLVGLAAIASVFILPHCEKNNIQEEKYYTCNS